MNSMDALRFSLSCFGDNELESLKHEIEGQLASKSLSKGTKEELLDFVVGLAPAESEGAFGMVLDAIQAEQARRSQDIDAVSPGPPSGYESVARELSESLSRHLEETPTIVTKEGAERQLLLEGFVAVEKGWTISVRPREHGIPHFHVSGEKGAGSFDLHTGEPIAKSGKIARAYPTVRKWLEDLHNRCKLLREWNRTRASDCPVGLVDIPRDCPAEGEQDES